MSVLDALWISCWSFARFVGCTEETLAGGMVAPQTKVSIQTALSVARTKLSVDFPERLTRITQSAEYSVLLLSPGLFCFVILWTHPADGVLALA